MIAGVLASQITGGVIIAVPTITPVSWTTYSMTFTVKNNHSETLNVYYEVSDNTPDAAYVTLASGATSGNLTIYGLSAGTYYYFYAQANLGGVLSQVASMYASTLANPEHVWELLGVDTVEYGADLYIASSQATTAAAAAMILEQTYPATTYTGLQAEVYDTVTYYYVFESVPL